MTRPFQCSCSALLALAFLLTSVFASSDRIYWSDVTDQAIKRSDINGAGVQTLVQGQAHPRSLAIDASAGHIYWIALGGGFIRRANLDGSGVVDLVAVSGNAGGVAVDRVAAKIYWTDPPLIRRANLDGTGIQDLVSGLSHPVALALDPASNRMYWTDIGTKKIQTSLLDGTGVQDFITSLGDYPAGLTIDLAGGWLYWTEAWAGTLNRAQLNGLGVQNLLSGLKSPTQLEIDALRGKIIFAENLQPAIRECNLDGTSLQLVVSSPHPWGLGLEKCKPELYCTPKINSQSCAPAIGYRGLPALSGANDFFITASSVLNNKFGLLIWSSAPNSAPFGGGTLCVKPPVNRTPHQNSGGNPPPDDCSGSYSFHFSQSYMGLVLIGPGSTIHAQYWSRDPGFAPPSNIGLTDALRFVVCP
jgi:hypothetical protein